MRQSWQMWKSHIKPEECDAIIEKIRKQEAQQSSVFSGIDKPETRVSLTRWVEDQDIRNMMWWYAKEANRLAFGLDVDNVGPIQFTEYNAEHGGKYDWHHDVDWQSNAAFDRKISVVLQLSDGNYYEGCDFQFDEVQNPDPDALRSKGTIICFPSYLRHRVTEITKGSRYSLVAWFEGPRWR
jgi:PKHD-type hydroxylase